MENIELNYISAAPSRLQRPLLLVPYCINHERATTVTDGQQAASSSSANTAPRFCLDRSVILIALFRFSWRLFDNLLVQSVVVVVTPLAMSFRIRIFPFGSLLSNIDHERAPAAGDGQQAAPSGTAAAVAGGGIGRYRTF